MMKNPNFEVVFMISDEKKLLEGHSNNATTTTTTATTTTTITTPTNDTITTPTSSSSSLEPIKKTDKSDKNTISTPHKSLSLLAMAKIKLLKDQGLTKHDLFKRKKDQDKKDNKNSNKHSYGRLMLVNNVISTNENFVYNYLCGNDKPLHTSINISISLMSAESILIKLFSCSQTLHHFKSFLIYDVGVSEIPLNQSLPSNNIISTTISTTGSTSTSHHDSPKNTKNKKEKIWDIYRYQRQNQLFNHHYLTLQEWNQFWIYEDNNQKFKKSKVREEDDYSTSDKELKLSSSSSSPEIIISPEEEDKEEELESGNTLSTTSPINSDPATTTSTTLNFYHYPINYSKVPKEDEEEEGYITLPYGYAYAIYLPFTACSHGLIKEDRVFLGPIRLTKKLAYQAVMLEICHYLYTEQILDTNFLLSLKAQGILSQATHYYNNEEDYYKNNKREEYLYRYLENISYIEKNKKLKLEGNYVSDGQHLKLHLDHGVKELSGTSSNKDKKNDGEEGEKPEEEEDGEKDKEGEGEEKEKEGSNEIEVDRPDSLSEYKRLLPKALMADDLWNIQIVSQDGKIKSRYQLEEQDTNTKKDNESTKTCKVKSVTDPIVEKKNDKRMDIDPQEISSEVASEVTQPQTSSFISKEKSLEEKWEFSSMEVSKKDEDKETGDHEFYVTIFSFGPELELYTRNAIPSENAFYNIIHQPLEVLNSPDKKSSFLTEVEEKEEGEINEKEEEKDGNKDENDNSDDKEDVLMKGKKIQDIINEIKNSSSYFKPAKDRNLFLSNVQEKQKRMEPRRSFAIVTKRPIPTRDISSFCVWLDGKISCKVKILHWNDQSPEGAIGIGNTFRNESFDYKISETKPEQQNKSKSNSHHLSKSNISSKGLYYESDDEKDEEEEDETQDEKEHLKALESNDDKEKVIHKNDNGDNSLPMQIDNDINNESISSDIPENNNNKPSLLSQKSPSIYKKITLTDQQIEAMTEFQEYFWNMVMWGQPKSLKRKMSVTDIKNIFSSSFSKTEIEQEKENKNNKTEGEAKGEAKGGKDNEIKMEEINQKEKDKDKKEEKEEKEENENEKNDCKKENKISITPDSECRMYMILPVQGFPIFDNYHQTENDGLEDSSNKDNEKNLSFLDKDYKLLTNWQNNFAKRWPKLSEIPDPIQCKWEIDWSLVEKVIQGPKISLYTWIRTLGEYIKLRKDSQFDQENESKSIKEEGSMVETVSKEVQTSPVEFHSNLSPDLNKSKTKTLRDMVYFKTRNSFDVLYDLALDMENKNIYKSLLNQDQGQGDPTIAYTPEIMEKLDMAMNQTYILTEHNNNRYHLKGIRQDITPKTEFYSSRYKISLSYLDYATITNKATVIEHPDSVMIEASHIKIATNMLKPSSQWQNFSQKFKSKSKTNSESQPKSTAAAGESGDIPSQSKITPATATTTTITTTPTPTPATVTPTTITPAASSPTSTTNATTKPKSHVNRPLSTSDSTSSLFLIPDICKILPVPMELYRLAYLIPSLLHRIDRYLIVDQLKNKINLPMSHNDTLFSAFCSCSAHEGCNYERLENLGDSFIKFAVSIDIFRKYPNLDEGGMTFHRGKIICNKNLYEISLRKNFDALMFVNAFNPKGWHPPKVQTPYAYIPMEIATKNNSNSNNNINHKLPLPNQDIPSIEKKAEIVGESITTNTLPASEISDTSEIKDSQEEKNTSAGATAKKMMVSSSGLMSESTSYIDSPKLTDILLKEEAKKNNGNGSQSSAINDDSNNNTDVSTTTPILKNKPSKRKSKKSDNSVSLYQSTKGPLWRVISKKTLADFVESLTASYYVESGFSTAIRFCHMLGLVSENTSNCFKVKHSHHSMNEESLDKLKLAQSVINSDVNRFSIIYKHLYQAKYNDIRKVHYGFINNNTFYQTMLNANNNNNNSSNNIMTNTIMNPIGSIGYKGYPQSSTSTSSNPYYLKRKYLDYNPSFIGGNSMMMNENTATLGMATTKKKRRKRNKQQRLASATSLELELEYGQLPGKTMNESSTNSLAGPSVPPTDPSFPTSTGSDPNSMTIPPSNPFSKEETGSLSFLQINETIENKLKLFYRSKIENQKDKSLHFLAKIFPFDAIEEKLHYHFKNRLYLVEAFTHASYTTVITHNYERLEFLGDATLDWILIRFFFLTYPTATAAELSELRQAAVNNESLARLSIGLGYHYYLMHHSLNLQNEINLYIDMLGKKNPSNQNTRSSKSSTSTSTTTTTPLKNSNKKNNKKTLTKTANLASTSTDINTYTDVAAQHPLQSTYEGPKVLGDLFEAVIGAVLVDSNYNVATVWRVFRPLLSDFLDKHASPENLNQSTVRGVHEYCQQLGFAVNDLQYR